MARLAAGFGEMATHDAEFVDQFGEWREVEVAFQQGRSAAVHAIGLGEQRPDRIADGRAMGVDLQVRGLVVVAGDVDVGNAPTRQRRSRGWWR